MPATLIRDAYKNDVRLTLTGLLLAADAVFLIQGSWAFALIAFGLALAAFLYLSRAEFDFEHRRVRLALGFVGSHFEDRGFESISGVELGYLPASYSGESSSPEAFPLTVYFSGSGPSYQITSKHMSETVETAKLFTQSDVKVQESSTFRSMRMKLEGNSRALTELALLQERNSESTMLRR